MDKLISMLLTFIWNFIYEYQRPVLYFECETNNNYSVKHIDPASNLHYIFEVKQIKLQRRPQKPFWKSTVYLYDVNQYLFVNGKFVDKVCIRYPEYSLSLFRNTKVPHVLAINAFLEKHKAVGE